MKNKKRTYTIVGILLAIIALGIGYAAVTTLLEIDGTATALQSDGVKLEFTGTPTNSGTQSGNAITSTSGLSGDLTLYAKWSGGSNLATDFILALTEGASSSSTDIITATSNNNTCTNTFAYDGTTHNNLRYVGLTPCNYVKFNCDSNKNCEIWRIIGVMYGVDSAPVLKLIKNDLVGQSAWNSTSNNTWINSTLYNTLNTTYLQSLNANVVNDFILSVPWFNGGVNINANTPTTYTAETSSQSSSAYIGLQSFTDFAYATSATSTSTRNTCLNTRISGYGSASGCAANNYLFKTNQYELTIDKYYSGTTNAIYITNIGNAQRVTVTSPNYYYRPVVYLKSNVKINTSEGDGSSGSPYELIAGN